MVWIFTYSCTVDLFPASVELACLLRQAARSLGATSTIKISNVAAYPIATLILRSGEQQRQVRVEEGGDKDQ